MGGERAKRGLRACGHVVSWPLQHVRSQHQPGIKHSSCINQALNHPQPENPTNTATSSISPDASSSVYKELSEYLGEVTRPPYRR